MALQNDEDYREALREVSPYFDNEPELGSFTGNRFDMLCMLIEEYEKKHYPI